MSEYRGEITRVSRSEPENVRRLAYRQALRDGCPWRALPFDGILVLFGGPGAADLGEHSLGRVDLPVYVVNELLRRVFAGFTGPDSDGTRMSR